MSKAVKITLIVLGVVFIGIGIVMGGFMIRNANSNTDRFGLETMMGRDRWNANDFGFGNCIDNDYRNDRNMNNWGCNDSQRGSFGRMNDELSCSFEDDFCRTYPDRMGSNSANSYSGCNSTSSGMRGTGNFPASGLYDQEPLTLAEAENAIKEYIADLDNDDLELAEVMIFDNHAYAEIVEKSTSIGAMEVLVDPVTLEVFPEYGPNMMWNLKYGMVTDDDGFLGRGMMNHHWNIDTDVEASSEMDITPEQAIASAQNYLDSNLPGTEVEDHADEFYGYYTLHVIRDGEVIGMLSVNGFSGDVFLHTWHGNFIEMSDVE